MFTKANLGCVFCHRILHFSQNVNEDEGDDFTLDMCWHTRKTLETGAKCRANTFFTVFAHLLLLWP